MLRVVRRVAFSCSLLTACTGEVGEPQTPYTAVPDPSAVAGDTGGMSTGGMSGATTSTGFDNGTPGTGGAGAANGGTSGTTTAGVDMPDGGDSGGVGTSGTTGGGSTGGATTGGGTTGGGTTGGGTTGGGTTGGGTTGGGTTGGVIPDPTDPCENGSEALTTGLRLRDISLYQALEVPLVTGGAWVSSRSTPVVQGKRSLIRAFVDTLPGYTQRTVRGVLSLDNGGSVEQLTSELRVTGASSDASLASTFNFDVAGAKIGATTKLSVALIDPACSSGVGNASDARFPASGTQSLGATKIGKLRVVLVPIRVSGRDPDTSPAQLAQMRAALLAHYPVPDVEVTARALITATTAVTRSGTGWNETLSQVMRTRSADNPADDVYYYGIMAPAASFSSYCSGSCILGLAPLTTRVSPDQQAGLGVGFLDDFATSTMVHELGHAHGRGHAPCVENGGSIDGVDQSYPNNDGSTGVWGWDSRDGTLQSPTAADVMGYCDPSWISDYTYEALAARSLDVNTAARPTWIRGPDWHGLTLYADGTARWGGLVTSRLPGGDIEMAQVLNARGELIDEVEVVRISLSHLPDQLLYIPEPGEDWASIVLTDRTLTISNIAPVL